MVAISVCSANICGNPARAQSKVVKRMRDAHEAADVTFGQEIILSRYKSAWIAEAKRLHRGVYGHGVEVPITVPFAFRMIDTDSPQVHGGLSKVSPSRYYTTVETVHAPTALKVAFVNLHPVSKGYDGARNRASQWSWRHTRLNLYWAAVEAECARLVAAGYTVVVGGDCNWPNPPRPHPAAAVLAGSGLDHMWVVAGKGARVTIRPQKVIPAAKRELGMDHPLIVGNFDLAPVGAKPPAPSTPAPTPTPVPSKEPTVASTVSKVLKVAAAEVGYHEGRSGSNWNNIQKFSPAVPGLEWSQGQAWCATFVSWVALKAGCASLYPRTASTDAAASWWQKQGRWSEYPAVGAQGFLAHGTDEYHTFIVERFDATYVYTIEGNTNTNGSSQGDGVYRLKRRRTSSAIEGYGYPRFPEGITSADPKWAHTAPSGNSSTDTEEMTVGQYEDLKKLIENVADDVKAIKASQGRNESNYKRLNIVMGDVSEIAKAVSDASLNEAAR